MAATSRGTHALPNNSINKNNESGKCITNQKDRNGELCADAKNCSSKYASFAREKFNSGRKIQIKNIPPNLKTEDVEKFLKGYDVKEIKINAKQANVSFNDGSHIDEIVKKLDGQLLNNATVSVSVLPYTNLLCIAHLPKDFTNENFTGLIAKYSGIDWSFLMHFDDTDESLQYGLVKLNETADQNSIKEEFDWMEMEGCKLQADYVENCTEYEKLFSRCLFIDNLPKTFKEAHKLREIFNCVSNPIYCQIMVKDKESLGYGIIEYKQAWEARETRKKLADYNLDGVKIRITFCIPEMQAVAIFNRFMYKTDNKSQTKGSLLPDPVMTNPLTINNPLVKGLALQNPELMKNFMQALQQLQTSYQTSVVSQSNKPGLLGPAPSLPLSPIMNPNMQLGLMIFLATQLNQQFTGPLAKQLNNLKQLGQQSTVADIKPSLLGDPLTAQANAVIQTLTSQVRGNSNQRPSSSSSSDSKKSSTPNILRNSRDLNINLLMNLGQIMSNLQNQNKTENLMSKNIQPPQNGNGLFPAPLMPNQNSAFPKKGITPTMNGSSFLHNVQSNISKTFVPNSGPKPLLSSLSQQQAAPLSSSSSSKPTSLLGEPPAYLPKVSTNVAGKGFSLGSRNDYQQPVRRSSETSSYSNRGSYSGQDYSHYNDSGYWADIGNESYYDDAFSDTSSNKLSKTDYSDLRKEDIYSYMNTNTDNSNYSSQNHSGLQNSYQPTSYQQSAVNYSSLNQSNYNNNNSLMDSLRSNADPYSNSSSQLSNSRFSAKNPPSLLDNLDSNKNYSSYSNSYNPVPSMADYNFMKSLDYSSTTSSSSYSSSYTEPGYDKRFRDSSSLYNNSSSSYNSSNSSYLLKTPNSQKRSYSHLLPPPEPSPEGSYIGQHSQGLGGHYPESYCKRIKLDSQFN